MHKFRILQSTNLQVAWLVIEEGNINIETGIRFMYCLYDYDMQPLERRVFIINGDDFANIGNSSKDTRIAILELLLLTLDAVIVKE
jgi:hypothetical protein